MLATSEAYQNAIGEKTRKSKIEINMTTPNGGNYTFTDDDIVRDSLQFNNQCVNGQSFEYGSVYAGSLSFSVVNQSINRYTLYNSKVTVVFKLFTGSTYEDVQVCVVNVTEATRAGNILHIKGLDSMINLEVAVDEETYGTPFLLLQHIGEKCGVELAQNDETVNALVNGNKNFTFVPERVGTYRDCLSDLAIMTGTFATFDRYGKLKLTPYGTAPALTITNDQRNDGSFSDYETIYGGVRCRFFADENYYPYEIIDPDSIGGLILDFGDIPIVNGEADFKNECLQNVLNLLLTVRYTPASFKYLGDPAIELGDMIRNTVGGESVDTLITKIAWKYRSLQTLEGTGSNPLLSEATDKVSRQISTVQQSADSKTIGIRTFTNIKEIEVNAKKADVISFNYATAATCSPFFAATIQINMSADGYVILDFLDTMLEMPDEKLIFPVTAGKNVLSFNKYFTCQANERHAIVVRASAEYNETVNRVQAAEIATQDNAITPVINSFDAFQPADLHEYYPDGITVDGLSVTRSVSEDGKTASSASIMAQDNAQIYYLSVKPGDVYTVTRPTLEDGNRFEVYYSQTISSLESPELYETGYVFSDALTTGELTVPDEYTYMVIYLTKDKTTAPVSSLAISRKVQNAPITWETVPVDTTPPTGVIDISGVRSVILAQGIATASKWDGTITVFDTFDGVDLSNAVETIKFNGAVDSIALVEPQIPKAGIVNEPFYGVYVTDAWGYSFDGAIDQITINSEYNDYTMCVDLAEEYNYSHGYVIADQMFVMKTEYSYQGIEVDIDSGRMKKVTINTDDFNEVESVVISNG